MPEDATTRNVTEDRYRLFRLCDCPTCEGRGKVPHHDLDPFGKPYASFHRCPDCRGEGRIRQEVATCATPEAVGVAIVTLAREGEWEDGCPFGLLDTSPDCEECGGFGYIGNLIIADVCPKCNGAKKKPTGTWLILPWTPSARNLRDAGRMLQGARKHG